MNLGETQLNPLHMQRPQTVTHKAGLLHTFIVIYSAHPLPPENKFLS